jgi:hypothetical protein
LCINQVHEGHPQEVQDGRLEALVDTDEYDYSAQHGRGRRAHGPEGVPEHDRLPLVLDGDEASHPVFGVSVHSFSGFAEDFISAGRQADLQVSLILLSLVFDTRRPLPFRFLVFRMPILWGVVSIRNRLRVLTSFWVLCLFLGLLANNLV